MEKTSSLVRFFPDALSSTLYIVCRVKNSNMKTTNWENKIYLLKVWSRRCSILLWSWDPGNDPKVGSGGDQPNGRRCSMHVIQFPGREPVPHISDDAQLARSHIGFGCMHVYVHYLNLQNSQKNHPTYSSYRNQ